VGVAGLRGSIKKHAKCSKAGISIKINANSTFGELLTKFNRGNLKCLLLFLIPIPFDFFSSLALAKLSK
jgi:hypothetical protein